MLAIHHHRGVTLIELMIGIAIISLLVVLGTPSFSAYLDNAKVRSVAENFLAGVQRARTEAVNRNIQVQFVMTTDPPIAVNAATANLSATAQNWMVRYLDPSINQYYVVEGKAVEEGSNQRVQINGGAISSITFNGLGATTLATAATFAFTNPTSGACRTALGQPGTTCLNVVVSVGGQARMCDPAVNPVTSPGDTRKC